MHYFFGCQLQKTEKVKLDYVIKNASTNHSSIAAFKVEIASDDFLSYRKATTHLFLCRKHGQSYHSFHSGASPGTPIPEGY